MYNLYVTYMYNGVAGVGPGGILLGDHMSVRTNTDAGGFNVDAYERITLNIYDMNLSIDYDDQVIRSTSSNVQNITYRASEIYPQISDISRYAGKWIRNVNHFPHMGSEGSGQAKISSNSKLVAEELPDYYDYTIYITNVFWAEGYLSEDSRHPDEWIGRLMPGTYRGIRVSDRKLNPNISSDQAEFYSNYVIYYQYKGLDDIDPNGCNYTPSNPKAGQFVTINVDRGTGTGLIPRNSITNIVEYSIDNGRTWQEGWQINIPSDATNFQGRVHTKYGGYTSPNYYYGPKLTLEPASTIYTSYNGAIRTLTPYPCVANTIRSNMVTKYAVSGVIR